jgi:hypothetical protein
MLREISSRSVACTLVLAVGLFLVAPGAWAGPERLEFNRDIRPILSDKCFACHGFDAKTREAKLRLDTTEGAYALKDGVQAIKPGELGQSEVWHRVTSTDRDEIMPPPESNKSLSDEEKKLLKRWIEGGAEYQSHWAFVLPRKPTPPANVRSASVRNPLDRFILSQLTKDGLNPSLEANRATLITARNLLLAGGL